MKTKKISKEIKRNYAAFTVCLTFIMLFNVFLSGNLISRYTSYLKDYQEINELAFEYNESRSLFLLYTREHETETLQEFQNASANVFDILDNTADKMQEDEDCLMMYRVVRQMFEHRQEILQEYIQYGRVSINTIENLEFQLERNLNLLTTDYLDYVSGRFSEYSKQTQMYLMLGNSCLVLLLFLVFVLTSRIYSNLLKAINRLTYAATEIGNQNFAVEDIVDGRYEEINFVSRTFNEMKRRISGMIVEINRAHEVRERLSEQMLENEQQKRRLAEAQMRELQMQINPHFLFNTLSLIIRSIQMGESDTAIQLVKATSVILRKSIEIREKSIGFNEEIELLEMYLYIQRVHCKGRIGIQMDVRKSYNDDDFRIPPLILQPLVENAIQHGLENVVEGGLVQITITEKADHMLVEIRDNGCGIPQEVIRNLKEQIPMKRIGLSNVWERLRLFYHRDDVMDISSSEKGTIITLHLYKQYDSESGESYAESDHS